MKLQTMTIVILATILSSCAPVLQHSVIPTPSPIDAIAPTLASTSTATTTLGLSPTSTTKATAHPVLETGLPPSSTITPNATQAAQQEDIKNVIQAYFEIRYQLLSVSPPADIQQDVFGKLVSSRDDAKDFLTTETAKLAVERKWYELNKLRYAKYEYSLKYTDISFDATAQMATVSLHEYFEIICEKTMDNNSQNPSACAIGELTHEIVLHNENNQWKIISDTYWDSWWRQFRKPGLSTNEILQNINAKMQQLEAMPSPTP
ncbi:MAG: hypothetical protein KJZ72_20805 [Anaerolineales bacterium]|nr:hypothetical protein [Anaerolineales bacterium]